MLTTLLIIIAVILALALYGFVAILRDLDHYYTHHRNRW